MSAVIVQLPIDRSKRVCRAPTPATALDLSERFVFWRGASGAAYVHTVYSLVGCPEMPAANYVLVRRERSGCKTVLKIGRVVDEAASSNLAEIRHTGAKLGAHEVHVHLLANDPRHAAFIELDLRAGQMAEPRRANIPPSCA